MNVNLDEFDPSVLLLVVPLVVIYFGLLIFAVVDLLRDDRRVRGGNKGIWALIIVFINLFGPIIYLLFGRVEGVPEPREPGPGRCPAGAARTTRRSSSGPRPASRRPVDRRISRRPVAARRRPDDR